MDRTAWKLRSFIRKRARFGEDLCDLVTSAETPDGFGGSNEVNTTIATNLKCFYEVLASPIQHAIGGGTLTTLTHKITIEATPMTVQIKPDYKIVVDARGAKPVLTFRRPVMLNGSYEPLVKVAAELAE